MSRTPSKNSQFAASAITLSLLFGPALLAGQAPAQTKNPLLRQYRDGETLTYAMTGVNESWHYTIQADGVVKKDAAGTFIEEYSWSHMVSDGQPYALAPGSEAFRQRITLDPTVNPPVPDLTKVDPKLIGPITDFMTFNVDLWLALKSGQLNRPGDHFYVKDGTPQSWADGSRVLVGESAIDFDLTWKSTNTADGTAMLEIRHVPPEKSQVPLAAAWMQAPVGEGANNWVMIMKMPDGKYLGSVGLETFTVELKVNLKDGKILSGTMDNPVKTIMRMCQDQALTQCGPPQPHEILRKIEISLVQ
jgi:hypothetical protein